MADADLVTKIEYNSYKEVVHKEHEILVHENNRQNERLALLESKMEGIKDLTLSINTLATDMKYMLEELKAQGKRLESLETRDGDMWRSILKSAVTGIVALIIGFVFGQLFK